MLVIHGADPNLDADGTPWPQLSRTIAKCVRVVRLEIASHSQTSYCHAFDANEI